MGTPINDHNVALNFVNLCVKYDDNNTRQTESLVDKMKRTNVEIGIILDVTSALSGAKKKDKKVDFSANPMVLKNIAHIHRNNPAIFGDLIKGIPSHLPPNDVSASPLSREQITRENVINENLKDVYLSEVHIDSLSEDQIDTIIQGLGGQRQMYAADQEENLMMVTKIIDEGKSMFDAGRQSLRDAKEEIEHTIRNMGR